jgi:hypothetical protein
MGSLHSISVEVKNDDKPLTENRAVRLVIPFNERFFTRLPGDFPSLLPGPGMWGSSAR